MSDQLEETDEVLKSIENISKNGFRTDLFMKLLSRLNSILTAPSSKTDKAVWDKVKTKNTVQQIKEVLTSRLGDPSLQRFGFRLYGNMCDVDQGIRLLVEENIYLAIINTLKQPQYSNDPVVMGEGFRVLGLIAKGSEHHGTLIYRHKCKWCNHVTMALSEHRQNPDVVENGVMSLSYIFKYNAKDDYILLKGRIQLFKDLIELHQLHMPIQFHIIRLLTVLTTRESVNMLIDCGMAEHAMKTIHKFPDNIKIVQECIRYFERLTYSIRCFLPSDDDQDGAYVVHRRNLSRIKETEVCKFIQKQIIEDGVQDEDIIFNGLYILEYLGIFDECTELEAAKWSDLLFRLLEENYADSQQAKVIEVACECLSKIHGDRDSVPVSLEQCSALVHVIFLHHDLLTVFSACCHAIAQILPRCPPFALTLMGKGTHLKILEVMKMHPSSDEIQFFGCLFLINFQLKLPQGVRVKSNFDSSGTLIELSTLFCDKRHEIAIKSLCLGAITLLMRDRGVVFTCRKNPEIYWMILENAKTYSFARFLNHITFMFITLLCSNRDIARDLLYTQSGTMSFIVNLVSRNMKYRQWLLSGMYTMAALLNCEKDPAQEVEGVSGAMSLLIDIVQSNPHDLQITNFVIVTLTSFCELSDSVKLQIVEHFLPLTLRTFITQTDEKVLYYIYKFWVALTTGDSNDQVLSAALYKAIQMGHAVSVQIILEMNANVNKKYNDQFPLISAIHLNNPIIVEHILWQNVDIQQVKLAISMVTDKLVTSRDEASVDIMGYLLREFGYRVQDKSIDWCNLNLDSLEPEWLFIIIDLDHVHYENPSTRQGRKISLASRARDVGKQMTLRAGGGPSTLTIEFTQWKRGQHPIQEEEEEEEEEGDRESEGERPPPTTLESTTGDLDELHQDLCEKFLQIEKEASLREMQALKDLNKMETALTTRHRRRIGSIPARNTSNSLSRLDVSNNNISFLTRLGSCKPIMRKLGDLTELNLNHNKLREIPCSFGTFLKSVKALDLSYNELASIPVCVFNMPLVSLNLSNNKIESVSILDNTVESLFCHSLKNLALDRNFLKSLPSWIKSVCPNLEAINFSTNRIHVLADETFGFQLLRKLDLSHNQIASIPELFFVGLDNLNNLDLSHNNLVTFPKSAAKCLLNLKILELSSNRLDMKQVRSLTQLPSITRLHLSNNRLAGKFYSISFFESRTLTELDLSKNAELTEIGIGEETGLTLEELRLNCTRLTFLSSNIGNLTSLRELDLSSTFISKLPLEMGKLVNLEQLRLKGLKNLDIPLLKENKIIEFLRQQLLNSRPHNRIKLFVVGLEARGKTSLCSAIIKRSRDRAPNVATLGVDKTDWNYKGNSENLITIWDFAGQEQFYVTHQCFLSQRGVYLVVFSLKKGVEEVERIKPWLYTIQSRTPNANVVIVGTHLDETRAEEQEKISVALQDLMRPEVRGFLPNIDKNVHFVNTLMENTAAMSRLRIQIINICETAEATPADIKSNTNRRVKIMGEKVPAYFMELEKFVTETQILENNKYYPFPILQHDELINQLTTRGFEIEYLENAVDFLHECGTILHYNNYSQGLNKLYFIKPEWLSDIFSQIITIPEVHRWVKEGILKKSDMLVQLNNIIKNTELIEKLVYIMERFEIILNLNSEEILIPSQLPSTKPPDLNPHTDKSDLVRLYRMPCIPHGFWSRLITRLALFSPVKGQSQKRVMWKSGIYIETVCSQGECTDMKYLLVESIQKSTVRISTTLCDILGRVVYHIDTMVQEWYSGFLDLDIQGNPMVEYLVPCKVCEEQGVPSPGVFTLQHLIERSEVGDEVTCSSHTLHQGCVNIADIAPDVLLKDFKDLLINDEELEYNVSSTLGEGTQGAVCTGSYRGGKVAVKVFGVNTGEEYEYDKHPHYQLRQECSILKLLNHPSIVRFVGVVLRPRCCVLELAGYGSLDKLIKTNQEAMTRRFVHRVLLQISEGLDYLHRHHIIYRDLKPQNILIVSKDVGVPMNAKLTDFGVSGLTTEEGLMSYAGTAGYMDPNINARQVYDSSVDIFSFGILIREVLTGKRVLSNLKFPQQIAGEFLRGKAAIEKELGWHDLTQLLNQCVNPNPEHRPDARANTDLLSRSDVLCLRTVHDPFNESEVSLREYCLIQKSMYDVELWVKVRFTGKCTNASRYGLAVILLSGVNMVQKAIITIPDDFKCFAGYLKSKVIIGGSSGCITVVNSNTYRIESKAEIGVGGEAANLDHPQNTNTSVATSILSMICLEQHDPTYLIMGMGNGKLYVFNDRNIDEDHFTAHYKILTVDKVNPITKLESIKTSLLVAVHQVIHIYDIEHFDEVYTFDLNLVGNPHTHITKMCVVGSALCVSLFNTSTVYVCRFKNNTAGVILDVELEPRKTVHLNEMLQGLKSKPSSRPGCGPSFEVYDQAIFQDYANRDIKITSMSGGNRSLLLGLGNGVLVRVDTTTFKLDFVARRHRTAVRVVGTYPLSEEETATVTLAEDVVDFKGQVLPHVTACVWTLGDERESLERYLQARSAMVHK